MTKRKALGKGLSALIPDVNKVEEPGSSYFQCPVEEIEPNPYQPRQEFAKFELDELVASIKEKGVITPLLVSKVDEGYQLIAGERRWRASQMAGLDRVPVVVRETTPMEALELALIENIHRADLNPIEEALAYQRWLEEANMTQDVLAKRVGKDRSTITNMLRLLKLPQVVQQDLVGNRMSMGHARVLAGLKDEGAQKRLRDVIIKKELSVRQAEALLKRENKAESTVQKKPVTDHYFQSLADDLKRSLGTKVDIQKRGKKGSIKIYFYSDEELDRLLEHLT